MAMYLHHIYIMVLRFTFWRIGPHCHSGGRLLHRYFFLLCFQVAPSAEQKATVSSHAPGECV